MKRSMFSLSLSCAATLACACDLVTTVDPPPDAHVDVGEAPIGGAHVTHAVDGAAYLAFVDASSTTDVIYLDLDGGAEVTPADPAGDPSWDVAFKRSEVRLNGGVSGTGGVTAAALDGTDLAAVTVAPASGFVSDAPDGADADTTPDLALGAWYTYDSTTHVLSPADRTYVVHTSAGAYVKIRFAGYYDQAGTSGHPSFRWAIIPGA
jgi:hypothetical protein